MRAVIYSTFLVVSMVLSLPVWADDSGDKAIALDRNRIAGIWKIAELTINGDKAKAEDLRKLLVTNEQNGKWTLRSEGKIVAKGTSKIDPAKKPKTIDFTVVGGDQDGKSYKGIYELGTLRRKMCFHSDGEERPGKFESNEGSDCILVVFEPFVARREYDPGS